MSGNGVIFFKNAKVVNVFTKEILQGSFGIEGEKFLFVDYSPDQSVFSEILSKNPDAEVFDLEGGYVTPTFIDGHIHIESSHLIPSEFEKFALRSGVSRVVVDPHEIANVCGEEGVKFMLSDARLLEVYVMVPSCVPASPFETSGAELGLEEVERLLDIHENVLGLAEVMNYPGVINRDPEVLAKIKATKKKKKLIDGHAPLLRGSKLNRYIFEGVMSDHECTKGEEALEKLRLGTWVMVREGTASKNIYLLESLRKVGDLRRVMLVTDDISPLELENYMLKTLQKASKYVDPIEALQMVTINPATYFGLETGIKPGNQADFLIFESLEEFSLKDVWIKGKPLEFWEKTLLSHKKEATNKFTGTINYAFKKKEDFFIPGIDYGEPSGRARVIKPIKHSLITEEVLVPSSKIERLLKNREINRIYVLERHKGTERIGKGLIWGILKEGAVASPYAHDSHNVVVIGCELEDIVLAVNTLKEIGGGFVAVKQGRVIGKVALEVAGIMGTCASKVINELKDFYQTINDLTDWDDLLLAMSFFSLSAIPEIKITDQGLIKNFEKVGLYTS